MFGDTIKQGTGKAKRLLHAPALFACTLLMLVFTPCLQAQDADAAHKLQRSADRHYWEGDFEKASEKYKAAEEADPDRLAPSYNKGNSDFQLEKYEEAEKSYRKAVEKATKPDEKAAALHNLGNTFYQQQKLDEAAKAYTESLKLNPGDAATAKNLALTQIKQEQQKQQQEQNKQNQQQQQKNGEEQERQQEQQQKSEQPEQQDQQEQEKQKGQESQQNQQSQEQEHKQGSPKANGADDLLLRIAEQEEQKVQEKLQQQEAGKPPKNGKDW